MGKGYFYVFFPPLNYQQKNRSRSSTVFKFLVWGFRKDLLKAPQEPFVIYANFNHTHLVFEVMEKGPFFGYSSFVLAGGSLKWKSVTRIMATCLKNAKLGKRSGLTSTFMIAANLPFPPPWRLKVKVFPLQS